MCNRIVQEGTPIKPGERVKVLLRGPGGEFEIEYRAVFGGPARSESKNYWLHKERAEEVIIPGITAFGEQHEITGVQGWEAVPEGSALEGFLLPRPPLKDYRLLKIKTRQATPEQEMRLGNDRAPVVKRGTGPVPPPPPDEYPVPKKGKGVSQGDPLEQGNLFDL